MKLVMNATPHSKTALFASLAIAIAASFTASASPAHAQVRTKKPDRGVYQPNGPTLYPSRETSQAEPAESEDSWLWDDSENQASTDRREFEQTGNSPQLVKAVQIQPLQLRDLSSDNVNQGNTASRTPQLHHVNDPRSVRLQAAPPQAAQHQANASMGTTSPGHSRSVQQVSFEPPVQLNSRTVTSRSNYSPSNQALRDPQSSLRGTHQQVSHQDSFNQYDAVGSGYIQDSYPVEHFGGEVTCGCEGVGCDSCSYGTSSCDGYGCDSIGCGSCGRCSLANGSLCLDPCRWFASMEVLLLFRKGDLIPALVTTSPGDTLIDDAGQLPDATILAGGEKLFDDMTAGGRLTLGTWIDDCHNRSIVGRLWTSTESDYSFSAREGVGSGNILAIPTTLAGAANAAVISFPDSDENSGRFGSVSVSADSNVFGGDVSVRQFWKGGLGTTFDVLYGYQYMRLDENLSLSTSSTFTQELLPTEVGDNLTTSDSFDTTNEFHGGQLGLAGRYREGCWSFDFLAKFAFGQVSREIERRGSSVISTGTPPAGTSDTGILVTDTNSGTFSDDTFGWVPELDVSLGWHKYPRFDVTFGYNLIAMTNAARLSDVMDPNNSTDAPRVNFTEDTFYLQGLHFGIRHVY
ncbi:Putative beta barrel porin-7 (BBP7) [Neorhodopirellula lusitana]|uniref:Beta barrel porin-7 (BBP7) n=2 Tax=Neorhodopirellula lusitana TaxID=445327 RepID=A0ABY1PSX8_9BACT|nr:Putative beta barrel porin-7 (BBP7) [Neorhodopirellula lusitana]